MQRRWRFLRFSFLYYLSLLLLSVPLYVSNGWAEEGNRQELMARLAAEIEATAKLSDDVKKFVLANLLKNSTNPVLVAEVAAQNSKNISLDAIKNTDNEWKAKEGRLPLFEQLMANTTAGELGKIVDEFPVILECFVMDNKGAIVGQYNETTDYWQGDEPKWRNSYNDGEGGVDVGPLEIDQSTALAQQQISLPIIDGDGRCIGAITYGLDVNALRNYLRFKSL